MHETTEGSDVSGPRRREMHDPRRPHDLTREGVMEGEYFGAKKRGAGRSIV